jgi:TRAP-type C4-dicarboxylate transport system substrate-binding protein
MRNMTIYASDGDPESLEMMKAYYRPKVLNPEDIQLGLRNRMIDGVPIPAFLANALQIGTYAPYMVDLRWAPITGALVVRATDWDRLEPAAQQWILEACEAAGRDIRRTSREEDDAAVRAMQQKHGLTVVSLSTEAEAEWRAEVERMYPRIRGTLVPEGMFDAAVEALREYRQSQP